MFKYVKWELLHFMKSKYKFLIFIGVMFLLAFIVPFPEHAEVDGIFFLFWIPYFILVSYFLIATFIMGTKMIVDTYRKKTFLLESMISYSPAKLLFTKYIMAIIVNVTYGILFILSVLIIYMRVESLSLLKEIFEYLLSNNLIDFALIVKGGISLVISSISFTSLITMVYVLTKCINPSKKGNVMLGVIIWWIVLYIQTEMINSLFGGTSYMYEDMMAYFGINIVYLIMVVIYYFITVKLIKDKLEVYS